MFSKNAEKETINILLQENKRLKRENQRLRKSLETLAQYKEEYKDLNKQLTKLKQSYSIKLKDFEKMELEYNKELEKILYKK